MTYLTGGIYFCMTIFFSVFAAAMHAFASASINTIFLFQLVKEQFPEESYTLTNYLVRFSGGRNPSVGIKVDNSRELEGKGWNWCIDNGTEENRVRK